MLCYTLARLKSTLTMFTCTKLCICICICCTIHFKSPLPILYLCIYCTLHIYIIVQSPLAMFACRGLTAEFLLAVSASVLCLTLYTVYYIYGIFLLYTIYTLAVCYIICILLLHTICPFMKKFPNNPVKKLRAYYTL